MNSLLASLRKSASRKALTHIKPGMIVGLGSGSTVADSFLPLFVEEAADVMYNVFFIPSSRQIEFRALEMGLKILSFNQIDHVDVTIDSADLIERRTLIAIKGGGGAFLMEKVLSSVSDELILIADEKKLVEKIQPGALIPIEVPPDFVILIKKRLEKALGVNVRIRTGSGKVGPVITDLGNAIIDVPLPEDYSLEQLDGFLKSMPGVLENGIFKDLVSRAYVGTGSGVLELERGRAAL
ncbi:MAG: ribose 5-phosphate isomerase A [Thermoproteota archaeon]|nr:ribose 5-phosphate isomerase A [Candidatus Brockarchaeota archaeon]